MFRLIKRFVVIPFMFAAPVFLALDEGVPGLIFGWLALGYVIWRAAPAMRADLHTVRGWLPGTSGKHTGSGILRVKATKGDL